VASVFAFLRDCGVPAERLSDIATPSSGYLNFDEAMAIMSSYAPSADCQISNQDDMPDRAVPASDDTFQLERLATLQLNDDM
jgi:hypothetical protein